MKKQNGELAVHSAKVQHPGSPEPGHWERVLSISCKLYHKILNQLIHSVRSIGVGIVSRALQPDQFVAILPGPPAVVAFGRAGIVLFSAQEQRGTENRVFGSAFHGLGKDAEAMICQIAVFFLPIRRPGLSHDLPAGFGGGGSRDTPFQQKFPGNAHVHAPGLFQQGKLPAGVVFPAQGAGINRHKAGSFSRIPGHIGLRDVAAQRLSDQHRCGDPLRCENPMEVVCH